MNLQKFRIIFALTSVSFLVLCNLTYLFAYSQNRQPDFASQIDQPAIKLLSLLILIGIIGFALIKPNEEGDSGC